MGILAGPVRGATGAKPAWRGVNFPMLGVALVVLVVAKFALIIRETGLREQKFSFNSEGCTHHSGMMSPEDIIPVFDGVFLSSSDERSQQMMKSIGVKAAPWGGVFAIWNVDNPGEDPKTALLELEGFPKGTAFRPHGMNYRRETGELFVVNHAFSQGGERIDVFKVSENFPQDPLPSIHPSLFERTPPKNPDASTTEQAQGTRAAPQKHEESSSDSQGTTVDIGEVAASGDGDGAVGAGGGVGDGADRVEAGADGDCDGDGDSGGDGASSAAPGLSKEVSAEVELDNDYGQPSVETVLDSPTMGNAAPESGVVAEAIVETPKEKAKRIKRETKAAVIRAKSEATKKHAEEKAIAKAVSSRASVRSRALSRGTPPVKLSYSFSVEHELITDSYGVLNDLILAGDDELYVTQFLPMRLPLHGSTHPDGLLEALKMIASIFFVVLRVARPPVIHCTGIRSDEVSCKRLVRGEGVMFNGIALSPNKERLLVADSMSMQLVVFNRSLETGALTLRQRLDLPGSPDNLEIDLNRAAKGEEAYTLGLVRLWDFFAYSRAMETAEDPSDGLNMKMAGGMASIVFNEENGMYESSLEMWQDGSLLSISSAASTASGSRLLGSAVEEGFLLCRPPACPTPGSDGTEEDGGCSAWGPPPRSTEG